VLALAQGQDDTGKRIDCCRNSDMRSALDKAAQSMDCTKRFYKAGGFATMLWFRRSLHRKSPRQRTDYWPQPLPTMMAAPRASPLAKGAP